MIYYGVLVVFTVLVYLFFTGMHYEKKKVDGITLTFFFVMYLLLLCCRDVSVGNDTKVYLKTFEYVRLLDWKMGILVGEQEIGFKILRQLVACLGGQRLYICVVAALTVLPVLYLYKNEAEGAMFCISFFLISLLFELFFSGMRQGIAIALGVPAFYMVKRKKLIPYVLVVALACTFHKSAILLLLLYPIYYSRITKKWLWFIIPGIVLVYLNRSILLEQIIRLSGDEYIYKYAYLTGSSGQIGLMVLFILLAIYSYIVLDEKQASEEEIGLRNILLLAACIHLFTPLHPTISRLNYYFILFIPVAMTRINNRANQLILQGVRVAEVVMPTFFVLYFFLTKADSLHVFDYKLFF